VVTVIAAGQFEVSVYSQNAVSNGSASLTVYVVDASTLYLLGVGNATCNLPLRSLIVFRADVVCANTSAVLFHWSVPGMLYSRGRGLATASTIFAAAGVHQLTLTAWNDLGVRREYRATLYRLEWMTRDPPHMLTDQGREVRGIYVVPRYAVRERQRCARCLRAARTKNRHQSH